MLPKRHGAAFVLLFTGSALTIIGVALSSILPISGHVTAPVYGYQVILGSGLGLHGAFAHFLAETRARG